MGINVCSEDTCYDLLEIGKVKATLFKMYHSDVDFDAYDCRSEQLANAYLELFNLNGNLRPVLARKIDDSMWFDYHLHVSELHIDPAHRGFGAGSKALRMMRDFVDRDNLLVTLYACPPGEPTSKERNRLVKFYERNGFKRLRRRIAAIHTPLLFWVNED